MLYTTCHSSIHTSTSASKCFLSNTGTHIHTLLNALGATQGFAQEYFGMPTGAVRDQTPNLSISRLPAVHSIPNYSPSAYSPYMWVIANDRYYLKQSTSTLQL